MNGDPVTCLKCLLLRPNAPKCFFIVRNYPTHEMFHRESDKQYLPCTGRRTVSKNPSPARLTCSCGSNVRWRCSDHPGRRNA